MSPLTGFSYWNRHICGGKKWWPVTAEDRMAGSQPRWRMRMEDELEMGWGERSARNRSNATFARHERGRWRHSDSFVLRSQAGRVRGGRSRASSARGAWGGVLTTGWLKMLKITASADVAGRGRGGSWGRWCGDETKSNANQGPKRKFHHTQAWIKKNHHSKTAQFKSVIRQTADVRLSHWK